MNATARHVVLVTGLSGAGRATALKALEDVGFDAVDNLPLSLLPDLLRGNWHGRRKLALGLDVRSRDFSSDAFLAELASLRAQADLVCELVFLDCDDATLLRRFTETRRRHPLATDRPVQDGIAEERRVLAATTGTAAPRVGVVASGAEIERLHAIVREVPAAENVIDYAARLVRATRPGGPPSDKVPEWVVKWVRWGAGPRAGQALLLGAKARALLEGRSVVAHEDIRAVAGPVLRHRLLMNFQAEADGVDPDQIIDRLLDAVRA